MLAHRTARSERSPLARLLGSARDRQTTLVELAKLWAPGQEPTTIHDANADDIEDDEDEAAIDDLHQLILAAKETDGASFVEVGRDSTGAAIQALPVADWIRLVHTVLPGRKFRPLSAVAGLAPPWASRPPNTIAPAA